MRALFVLLGLGVMIYEIALLELNTNIVWRIAARRAVDHNNWGGTVVKPESVYAYPRGFAQSFYRARLPRTDSRTRYFEG